MTSRGSSILRKPLTFPLLGMVRRHWRTTAMANRSTRREAKAMMYAELAVAARQGIPLEVALSLCSQTVGEARRSLGLPWPRGADSRHSHLSALAALAYLSTGPIAYLLYALLGSCYMDVERVSRILALRLHPKIAAGMPMSEAMRVSGLDYDPQEIEMMSAGERWDKVPEALQALADFQSHLRKMSHYATTAVYPFYLLMLVILPIGFLYVRVRPKFDAIFETLGGGAVQRAPLLEFGGLVLQGMSFLALPLMLIGLFVFVRSFLNGSLLARLLLVFPPLLASLALLPFVLKIAYHALPASMSHLGPFWNIAALGAVTILWLLLATYFSVLLLRPLENLVLVVEGFLAAWAAPIVLVGTASGAEKESRWMGALSLALEAGVGEPEALRAAGAICGGRWSVRSHAAARLVESGKTIGQACRDARVFRSKGLANRLVLLDGIVDFRRAIRDLADDVHMRAEHLLTRTGRITEVAGVLLLGFVVLAVALSIYLPLFSLPLYIPTR